MKDPDQDIFVMECHSAPAENVQEAVLRICGDSDVIAHLAFECRGNYADSEKVLVLTMRSPDILEIVNDALREHKLSINKTGPSESMLVPGLHDLTSSPWRAMIPFDLLPNPSLVST